MSPEIKKKPPALPDGEVIYFLASLFCGTRKREWRRLNSDEIAAAAPLIKVELLLSFPRINQAYIISCGCFHTARFSPAAPPPLSRSPTCKSICSPSVNFKEKPTQVLPSPTRRLWKCEFFSSTAFNYLREEAWIFISLLSCGCFSEF